VRGQQGASLFWLAFSILVIVGAIKLGVGTLSTPGMGFMSFGAAGLLFLFSLARFVRFVRPGNTQAIVGPLFKGMGWWRVVVVLAALFLYALFLPLAGYVCATFLLMSFLLWAAGSNKPWRIVLYSLCMTIATFYMFSKWLNCQFPVGPFGF